MKTAERRKYLARLIRCLFRCDIFGVLPRVKAVINRLSVVANQAIKDARARLAAARREFYYLSVIHREPGSRYDST